MGNRLIVLYSRRREIDVVAGVIRDFKDSNFHQVKTEKELEWILKGKTVSFLILGRDLSLNERERALFLGLQNGVEIGIMPGLYESLLAGAKPTQIGEISVVLFPSLSGNKFNWQRCLNRILALFSVTITSPLFFIIALLIRLDSKGSVFYGQERVGRNGRTFTLWKFRTMVHNAETETGPTFCQANDSRVTRIGKVLRTTHLDELPQLINIFRGDMSWVGPRPERPVFVRKFEQSVPDYSLRHLVDPGLTGEAQINVGYDAKPEAKLTYDLQHLHRHGFWEDAKTILATIPSLLGRKGR
ncbi:MAG: sugar transferase [Desulfitobacterium hafniense]|nr:sugar transferase [Desulfitobacterium hafniense]